MEFNLEEIDRRLLIMENKYLQELIKGSEKPVLAKIRKKIDNLKSERDNLIQSYKDSINNPN